MAKKHTFECLRKIFYWPLKLFFPARIVGKENLDLPEKIITVTNHLSMLDIILVGMNVPKYRHFVGKKELEKSKFFKMILDWTGTIRIDRGKADMGAIKKIISTLRNGEGISIFPEGTRNKDGADSMNEVKAGTAMFALKGGAELVPVMIYSRQRVFRKNYIYIAPKFSVAEFGMAKVDSVAISLAAEKIERKMRQAKEYLNDYVENKRWIEIKAEKKRVAKLHKKYLKGHKAGKKALLSALKNI